MNQNSEAQPNRFDTVRDAPVHMLPPERVLLYSMAFGVRPDRCLEIGTLHGGSAMITVAALDDIGHGKLVCIDPEPQVTPEVWAGVEHRATLIKGTSPEVLPEAVEIAGGKFDLALIDGDHSHAGVVRDLVGVMDVLADGGYMLMHDSHYSEVRSGIDEVLRENPGRLVDCGLLSNASTPDANSATVEWGGIRVLRTIPSAPAATDLQLAPGTGEAPPEVLAILGLLAAEGEKTTLLLGGEVPAELIERTGGTPLSDQDLIAAAKAAQGLENGPLIVLGAGAAPTIRAVLDDADIAHGRLLMIGTGQPDHRGALEELPWLSWTRLRLVDLEYVAPRVVQGPVPGLAGGLGLVVLDAHGGETNRRTAPYAPVAQLVPELNSAGLPARISADQLAAARRAQAEVAAITSSTSWRITAPLRAAKGRFRHQP